MRHVDDALVDNLRGVLRGGDEPVHSQKLEVLLGVAGSDVRCAVNQLRCQGYPIASSRLGYRWGCRTEVEETVDNLRSRVAGMNTAIAGLERWLKESGR